MVAPSSGSEEVRYDIRIEVEAALKNLQELLRSTDSNAQKVKAFSDTVLEQSARMGESWKELLDVYKQLNAELSQRHETNIFGRTGGQDLMMQAEKYLKTLEEAKRVSETMPPPPPPVPPAAQTLDIQTNQTAMALMRMSELAGATASFKKQILEVSTAVQSAAKEWGISFEEAKARLQEMDAELSGTAQSSVVFGERGQEAWNKVGESAIKAGSEVEESSKLMVGGIDLVRLTLRFALVGALFEAINVIKQVFAGVIDGLKTMEKSVYDLANAEKVLSESGVNVSFKDLEAIVDRLHTKFDGLFSKTVLEDVVSNIAIVTKGLGLTTDQIEKMAATAAAIQLQHPDKSITEISTALTTSDMNGRLTTLAKFGVNTDLIKQKEDELAKSLGVSTKNLTENQRATIELDAAYEAATGGIDILGNKTNTFTGTQQRVNAVWQDFLTQLGKDAAPLLITILQESIKILQQILDYINKNQNAVEVWISGMTVFAKAVFIVADAFVKLTLTVSGLLAKVVELIGKIPFLKGIVKAINPGLNIQDTPTNPNPPPDASKSAQEAKQAEERNKKIQKYEDDLQKIMQDSADKKADIERDYQRKLQDIDLNYSQKLEDIARNTEQKKEDALRSYTQKVEDINRDASEKVAQAQQDYRQKEIDREKEYQQRLKELREKFLFDLEDALRERDARQVLRLIRQYNMDKANLEAKHKLDEKQSKIDLQRKIADIERDRQLKLEAAKREYDDKLKEIAIGEARARQDAEIWRQRELQDARIWHQRQLAEQREYLQRKLRDLADALAKELQLLSSGAKAATSILSSAYSTMLNGLAPVMSNGAIVGGTDKGTGWDKLLNSWNTQLSSWQKSGMYGTTGLAEGGSLLATRPTTLNVAENSPELVTAVPLNKMGQGIGNFMPGMTQSQSGGSLSLRIQLSDGLIAEIVDTSLDNVATQIDKIVRSK